jgi:hypothetical protein
VAGYDYRNGITGHDLPHSPGRSPSTDPPGQFAIGARTAGRDGTALAQNRLGEIPRPAHVHPTRKNRWLPRKVAYQLMLERFQKAGVFASPRQDRVDLSPRIDLAPQRRNQPQYPVGNPTQRDISPFRGNQGIADVRSGGPRFCYESGGHLPFRSGEN